jgi:hypothetical protein
LSRRLSASDRVLLARIRRFSKLKRWACNHLPQWALPQG